MKNFNLFFWLIGQWEGVHGNGIYHEEWVKADDLTLTGKAYIIKNGESKHLEKLKIHVKDSEILYTADVSHNPAPVSFKLMLLETNRFVFENTDHDFPQRITYSFLEKYNLKAIVESITGMSIHKIEYNLRKQTEE